jgi:hypothetical protein
MEPDPAVIVHGLGDALAALAGAEAKGARVTLLSAPGAALYAGCGWWRALVQAARAEHPNVPCIDILDCADGTGQAMAALRTGLTRLVLWPAAPGREAVVAIADSLDGFVLACAPTSDAPLSTASLNRGRATKRNNHSAGPARDGKSGPPGSELSEAGPLESGPGNLVRANPILVKSVVEAEPLQSGAGRSDPGESGQKESGSRER